MEYVVFSTDALQNLFSMVRSSIGSIFGVALYAFIGVLSVYLVLNIVSRIAR